MGEHLKEKELASLLSSEGKVFILKFWADWCSPCKRLEPILKELESTYTDVEVIGINIDQDSSIANKYEVKSIPTLIFILNKEVKRVLVGVNSKEVLENALRGILSEVK